VVSKHDQHLVRVGHDHLLLARQRSRPRRRWPAGEHAAAGRHPLDDAGALLGWGPMDPITDRHQVTGSPSSLEASANPAIDDAVFSLYVIVAAVNADHEITRALFHVPPCGHWLSVESSMGLEGVKGSPGRRTLGDGLAGRTLWAYTGRR